MVILHECGSNTQHLVCCYKCKWIQISRTLIIPPAPHFRKMINFDIFVFVVVISWNIDIFCDLSEFSSIFVSFFSMSPHTASRKTPSKFNWSTNINLHKVRSIEPNRSEPYTPQALWCFMDNRARNFSFFLLSLVVPYLIFSWVYA